MLNDFADHPIIQALDDTIGALTYLREGGTKMVQVDPRVWQDFIVSPSEVMPKIPEPTRVQQHHTPETPMQHSVAIDTLQQSITACNRCAYARTDGRALGVGDHYHPPLAIVNGAGMLGDHPMAQGSRLEGEAGALLAKMFEAIGFKMGSLYLTHAMKCAVEKKPENEALQVCAKFLRSELLLVHPKAIVLLGPLAAKALFVTGVAASGKVGQWNLFSMGGVQIPTITLHHPMRLLLLGDKLSVPLKRENWTALQTLREKLKV